MIKKGPCEFYGILEKIEDFTTLTGNIIPGTLVFESLSPFVGYYNENPHDYESPLYLYMAVESDYSVFDIARAFQLVKNSLKIDLDVAKASVRFNDKFFHVLRLRHIDGYSRLIDIQKQFAEHGIKPLKSSLNKKNIHAHVTLNKVFCLESISDGLFIDRREKNHAYIQMPYMIHFDKLIEVTKRVRNNWVENRFDAAMGYFLCSDEVIEIVRIYTDNLDVNNLTALQDLYLKKLETIDL
jgi:hypothetical protein